MKKIFFFGFSLAYPIPHTYTPPTSSTQISNQPQSQYPATNNQLQTQSSQTSQQSSVMIIYSFRF